jgi:hypothetical protein
MGGDSSLETMRASHEAVCVKDELTLFVNFAG